MIHVVCKCVKIPITKKKKKNTTHIILSRNGLGGDCFYKFFLVGAFLLFIRLLQPKNNLRCTQNSFYAPILETCKDNNKNKVADSSLARVSAPSFYDPTHASSVSSVYKLPRKYRITLNTDTVVRLMPTPCV